MIITCVGDCGVDYYIDHKILRPGGITLNFAVHARKAFPQEDSIEVITALGTDPEAATVKKTIAELHLVSHITLLSGKTPIQYIDHDERGEKKFIKYEEGILAEFRIDANNKQLIEKSDLVMTVIYSQIEKFFNSTITCRPKGLMVVDFMDLSDFGKDTAIVEKHISHFDIAFFGLEKHEQKLSKALKKLAAMHKKLFVITLGSNGSIAYDKGDELLEPAVKVRKILDTTGAGDAFAAAFLNSYVYTHDVQLSLKRGNQKAAYIVQQIGSF